MAAAGGRGSPQQGGAIASAEAGLAVNSQPLREEGAAGEWWWWWCCCSGGGEAAGPAAVAVAAAAMAAFRASRLCRARTFLSAFSLASSAAACTATRCGEEKGGRGGFEGVMELPPGDETALMVPSERRVCGMPLGLPWTCRGLGRGEANRRRRVTGGDCGAGMTVVEAAMEAAGSGACGEAALCFGVGSREGSGAAGSGVAPSVSLWWRVAKGCASSGAALPLPDTSSAITDVRV